jgi:hypothetical protein
MKLFSIKDALKWSFCTVIDKARFFFDATLMYFALVASVGIAGAIPAYFFYQARDSMQAWQFVGVMGIIALLVLCIWTGIWAGYMRICLNTYDGRHSRYNLLLENFRYAPRLLIGSLVYFVVICAGLILFIIPGIYMMIAWSFFGVAIVDKEMSIAQAFTYSYELTKEIKLRLVWTQLVNMVLINRWLVTPFMMLLHVYLYRQLENTHQASSQTMTQETFDNLKLSEQE